MNLVLNSKKGAITEKNKKYIEFSYEKNKDIFNISNLHLLDEDSNISFIFLEKELIKRGFNKIEIICGITNMELIKVLMKNKYIISGNYKGKYSFEKDLDKKKSWRISLTEKCNYRCFFCHEEGLDMEKNRKDRSVDEIYSLIYKGIEKGYNDITFTGGEPLIKSKNIVEVLNRLNKDRLDPDITIVTNGYLITEDFLDELLRYKGRIKFNFSMHSVNKQKYQEIVNPKNKDKNSFEKIMENIQLITSRGFKIKLNFVMLKGLNTSKKEIKRIMKFGIKYKIDTIKFLELLITDKLIKYYKYYYKITGIQKILEDDLRLVNREFRRDTFIYKNSNLKIELQKCTCEVGCSKCLLDKDISITSELEYFPCFLLNSKPIPINPNNIEKVVEKGSKIIEEFGKKYGDGSPLIISNPKYIKSKKEYYYTTNDNISYNKLSEKLEALGFKLEIKREFSEIYFKPNIQNRNWKNNNKILKLYQNSYNLETYTEVIQEVDYKKDADDIFYSEVTFFKDKKPNKIYNLKKYKRRLDILDFQVHYKYNWKIKVYKKEGEMISIGKNIETNKITILSYNSLGKKVTDHLNIYNLNKSMLKFLENS